MHRCSKRDARGRDRGQKALVSRQNIVCGVIPSTGCLYRAFDVKKRHFLFGMYLVSVESLQPVILNAGRVCSQDIGQSGVTHWYKCRNTMLVLNVGPWNVFLNKSWRLTTEFIILLYLSATKPFTLILLNCKNTDKNYLK